MSELKRTSDKDFAMTHRERKRVAEGSIFQMHIIIIIEIQLKNLVPFMSKSRTSTGLRDLVTREHHHAWNQI